MLLLEHQANVNLKDKFGNTPLMIAASRGDKEMVLELQRRGADLHVSEFKSEDHVIVINTNVKWLFGCQR